MKDVNTELMELKDEIFWSVYDAHLEFSRATEGMKEVTGDYESWTYGKFKSLQRLMDNAELWEEFEIWTEKHGFEY